MRHTLRLDDTDDLVELRNALETAFATRFTDAEASTCWTVGDIFQVLRSRFPLPSEGGGGCATAMAFYRVRQAFPDVEARSLLVPSTRIDNLADRQARRFRKELGQRSGFRSLGWRASLLGRLGGWTLFAGFIWLVLTAVVASGMGYAGVVAGALGLALILLDPGRLPADCRTLGDLARKTAALNFGRLHAQGAKARDRDLWAGLVEILAEYALVPKAEIQPGTLILSKRPRCA